MIKRILFLAILTLSFPLTSNAAILFATGEDTGGTVSGTAVGTASCASNICRSAYANGYIAVGVGSTADPPTNRFATTTFTAGSTIWVHARIGWGSGSNATTANATVIRLLDAGTARILVRGTGTAGQFKISTRNAAGTITDLVTSSSGAFPEAGTGIGVIDLFVNYAVSGTATLYADGVQIATYSGDVTTNSATTLNQADFAAGITSTQWFFSEIIVSDSDSRGLSLWTLQPQAAGNTQSWSPNTLANIAKTVINDATSISSSSNNQLTEWTTPVTPPAGTWAVSAIVQEARVLRGTSGPQNFEWLVRTIDGTQNVTGSVNPTTSFSNFSHIWATNPFSSSAWVIGDIASGFNLGIESLP